MFRLYNLFQYNTFFKSISFRAESIYEKIADLCFDFILLIILTLENNLFLFFSVVTTFFAFFLLSLDTSESEKFCLAVALAIL